MLQKWKVDVKTSKLGSAAISEDDLYTKTWGAYESLMRPSELSMEFWDWDEVLLEKVQGFSPSDDWGEGMLGGGNKAVDQESWEP